MSAGNFRRKINAKKFRVEEAGDSFDLPNTYQLRHQPIRQVEKNSSIKLSGHKRFGEKRLICRLFGKKNLEVGDNNNFYRTAKIIRFQRGF